MYHNVYIQDLISVYLLYQWMINTNEDGHKGFFLWGNEFLVPHIIFLSELKDQS